MIYILFERHHIAERLQTLRSPSILLILNYFSARKVTILGLQFNITHILLYKITGSHNCYD